MADGVSEKVPAWFWIVSGLALLWEAMGCYAYLTQVSMGPEQLAALPAGQRQLFTAMPIWVAAAYGIATWGGLLGAIALLMRRGWAWALFIASLVAVLVQFGWSFLIADAATLVGPSAYPLPIAIIAIAALLVWFSSMSSRHGWIR